MHNYFIYLFIYLFVDLLILETIILFILIYRIAISASEDDICADNVLGIYKAFEFNDHTQL